MKPDRVQRRMWLRGGGGYLLVKKDRANGIDAPVTTTFDR